MSTAKRRIFIIEDDPDFGFYIEQLIRDSELGRPRLIEDGLKGIQATMEDPPDLIVLDLDLPTLRGEEICRMLRSSTEHRSIPILVCSEMPQAQRKEMEMLRIGANAYVEKPFVEEGFIGNIKTLLDELAAREAMTSGGSASGAGGPGAATAAQEGDEFEGFRIEHMIGAGGMGTVYKAKQISLDREIALKVLLRSNNDSPETVERFVREALIMAKLSHPNIITIFDAGNTGYTFYIAMEYIPRGSLMDQMGRGPLGWKHMTDIISQTFDAIIYLHDNQVIHRDIKPGNILVSEHGVVKLVDFGISRMHSTVDLRDQLTAQNVVLGTAFYMAPEMHMGLPANEGTDQFALGRTMLQMLNPEQGGTRVADLSELRPDLPAQLCEAVGRCMHLDMSKRYPSMREARDAVVDACARVTF